LADQLAVAEVEYRSDELRIPGRDAFEAQAKNKVLAHALEPILAAKAQAAASECKGPDKLAAVPEVDQGLEPGRSTRAEVEAKVGAPAATIRPTLIKYAGRTVGIHPIFADYDEAGLLTRLDLFFAGPVDRAALLAALALETAPIFAMTVLSWATSPVIRRAVLPSSAMRRRLSFATVLRRSSRTSWGSRRGRIARTLRAPKIAFGQAPISTVCLRRTLKRAVRAAKPKVVAWPGPS
jgi:hypothetical protein